MQLPRGPGRQYPSPPSAGPAPSIILSGRGTTCLVKDTRPWSSSSWAAVGLRRTRDQGFRHVAGTLPDRPLGTDTAICGCLFGVLDTGRLFGSPWARWTPVSRAPRAIRPHELPAVALSANCADQERSRSPHQTDNPSSVLPRIPVLQPRPCLRPKPHSRTWSSGPQFA